MLLDLSIHKFHFHYLIIDRKNLKTRESLKEKLKEVPNTYLKNRRQYEPPDLTSNNILRTILSNSRNANKEPILLNEKTLKPPNPKSSTEELLTR
ncbi:hypothetical protein C922_03305 [Plasmodium inui San Antonio 1]|uniref:Uncharacterized protein n=1 Tax=Plasmodium inui San Antonio 1 TaxID=1237626 RepID=W7ABB8_9APIC|nr:hypothetical protein C922_03305 [Plasmodium inui San Antonio 1]EUD66389.1 hypothetical protein C922_03305 [Plasmodium inui San Antonio 1]